jgi:hypothetical protein
MGLADGRTFCRMVRRSAGPFLQGFQHDQLVQLFQLGAMFLAFHFRVKFCLQVCMML